MLQIDPTFEGLGEKLSQLIAEDFRNELCGLSTESELFSAFKDADSQL